MDANGLLNFLADDVRMLTSNPFGGGGGGATRMQKKTTNNYYPTISCDENICCS